MEKIALLRDRSVWNSAWLGKPGVNMNFMQFFGVIYAKNLCESEILSLPMDPLHIKTFKKKFNIKACPETI